MPGVQERDRQREAKEDTESGEEEAKEGEEIMWSTTEDGNVLVNLSAMTSVEFESNNDMYYIWAYTPCEGRRYVLLESNNFFAAKETFKKLKKVLMQATPVRLCYHQNKEEIEELLDEE